MTTDRFAYFDRLYGQSNDPYGVRARWYEARKRSLLLAALPDQRYESAFEPGCGTGELTVGLAERCTRLLASDFSPKALATARERCAGHLNVKLEKHRLPDDWPMGEQFDLIILSEVGYFLEGIALQQVALACEASLSATGTLVACDWRHDFSERSIATRDMHAVLDGLPLHRICRHEEDDFLLQVWSRDPRSVAQRDGIITKT